MKTHRIGQLVVAGVVAAAVAAPVSQAGTNYRLQVAGTLVAPTQSSEAQLDAGSAPSTRLVQIGGAQVSPSQLSTWESRAGATTAGVSDESSGIGTAGIAAIAALGIVVALAAASAALFRHRRKLVTA